MSRIFIVVVGLVLIGYGVYSGISWFYLGVILLIMGLVNLYPVEKPMGGCKDKNCSSGSCTPTNTKEPLLNFQQQKQKIKQLVVVHQMIK